jgi:hypothetical protein
MEVLVDLAHCLVSLKENWLMDRLEHISMDNSFFRLDHVELMSLELYQSLASPII